MNDSHVYCNSAVNAINNMRATSIEFQKILDNQIEQVSSNINYQELTYNELVDVAVQLTQDNVIDSGEELEDVDAVAWQLGMLCYVYRSSCPVANNKFDKLFIDTWNSYFNKMNNKENSISSESSINYLDLNELNFISSYHTRFESGIMVAGPITVSRGIKFLQHPIDKDKCYFVAIANLDGTGQQYTLSPKPMKIIASNSKKIWLLGYGNSPTESYSDYGIEIYCENNITRIDCVLIDRKIRIEYYK